MKKIERVQIRNETHPCWGHWKKDNKECELCMAACECHAVKKGEW